MRRSPRFATTISRLLVECGIDEVDQIIDRVKRIMIQATRLVLNDGSVLQVGDLSGDIRVDAKTPRCMPTRLISRMAERVMFGICSPV